MLETVAVILALGVVGLAGVLVVVWRGRSALVASAAGAEARALAAEQRVASEVSRATEAEKRASDSDARAREAELARTRAEEQLNALNLRHAAELKSAQERLTEERERLRELESRMQAQFRSVADDVLKSSNAAFLQLAQERFKSVQLEGQKALDERRAAVEQLVKPLSDTLARTEKHLQEFNTQREASFSKLGEQIAGVMRSSEQVRDKADGLINALRKPQVRGRWGEVQLRRVLELSGMVSYCDFTEQSSSRDDQGKQLRPDVVVKMPSDRVLVIDAKANIDAYLDATLAQSDKEREDHLERFATHMADQAQKLAAKAYWSQFERTPEMVVMFIPGDQLLDAALNRRPALFEDACKAGVVLATPSSLMGLLRVIEMGWKEQRLAEQSRELRDLGVELLDRAATAMKHFVELGGLLDRAVDKYNSFVGSYDTRLRPTLQKFHDAGGVNSRGIIDAQIIEARPRTNSPAPSAAPKALPAPEQ
ncbi:MAG: DNA recombination protein RmuC [Planctomycetota bacterium]|nr:DNA recombination protein RmuC [Planctomycetota bacterium]